MKRGLLIIDWFLYTSGLTACCATGLCMATERLINSTPFPFFSPLHLLVFGSTLIVYNAPRILRRPYASENNEQGLMYNHRFWYFVLAGVGLFMTLCTFPLMPSRVLVLCGVSGALAFCYSLPLLPFTKVKRLRDMGGVKIFVLASVWTMATSVLPLLYHQKIISQYPFEILLRFVFIFSLCVVFDIRDVKTDLHNNVYTLPNKMGIRNTYRLIDLSLFLFTCLSIIQFIRYPSLQRLSGALITALITKGVVSYLKKYPSDRAYMALADGVMLLYALLVTAI